ncbi:NADH-Ubiquinone/plastoquinone (complex I),various chains family protein [Pseudarthrobacter siccitolerans]|uniref:NADH-Ubiquinone/plastoquinone (Complex I),various chains family protein n=1 Tax=Pseudarthrobacter siccitolerans TaxID=861266 RepID=A0A024GXB9_9MICC|nr:Na+/H+ antiporter subunit A [Pseudarthrobacter siccitolerans]CCQ44139.1 NADH-Ubiquinone/plastoquinone (complex I),various chains family protein [Pseudarthrobacter siccitolerans]
MITVLAVHFSVAVLAPFLFRAWGRNAFYALAVVPAASFAWLLFQHAPVYSAEGAVAEVVPWIPGLQLEFAFRMDALAWVMSLLVLGVGSLVLVYCARYFKTKDQDLGGFGAQLLAFAGAMFGLVVADDLLLLFIFWELTTILSYLLIGFARTRLAARRSALQALMVTTAGGLAMLVGLIMLGHAAGTYRISAILQQAPELINGTSAAVVSAAVVLILVGAITKSALVPFHFWLPGAMAAPTPVSAYLHAAAMVKAGIYLVARLAPGFAETPFWQPVVLGLGLATMLVGGYRALRQTDIKLILAYGTVSQLGFLTMVVGLGTPDAALAGLAMLLAHGLFKATLFLVVGIIDHQSGTRDVTKLSGVFRSSRALGIVAAIGAASMAGVPLLGGFVAKESVLEAFVHHSGSSDAWGTLVLAGLVLGSVLTFAYSARFMWGAFATKPGVEPTPFKAIRPSFLAAPAILSVLTIAYGLWPVPVDAWIQPYAALFASTAPDAGTPAEQAGHLALWHGFTPALGLTALTFALGLAMYFGRNAVARAQSLVPPWVDADKAYQLTIGALDDVAVWITGRTQRGSLYYYLAVILSVAFVLPLSAILLAGKPLPEGIYLIDPGSPLQLVVAAGIVIGALAAVKANKRFLAVLMVSVTGYGIALMFALQGAPDLALTQMLVETIILVAFVLAMRSLPPELRDRTGGKYRVVRVIIGLGFGATMVFAGIQAMGARIATPVSLEFPRLAYEGGGGLNIVNVTLVDIRAWDTFGEISVLALAATGVASLIFVRGRGDRIKNSATVAEGTVGRLRGIDPGTRDAAALAVSRKFAASARDAWIVAGRTLAPERRSIIFEVVTRLVFHSMIIFSLYLLLAGHNLPGGGFAGGLTAGLALTIRYLAGGRFELREATPVSAGALLGIGLAVAAASGAVPLLLGGQVFQTAIVELWLPVFGDIKFVTSTIFDIGVYIVVVGLVLDVLRSLGAEIDEHFEQRHADPASDTAASHMADDGEPEGFPAQTTSRGQA